MRKLCAINESPLGEFRICDDRSLEAILLVNHPLLILIYLLFASITQTELKLVGVALLSHGLGVLVVVYITVCILLLNELEFEIVGSRGSLALSGVGVVVGANIVCLEGVRLGIIMY